MKRNECLTRFSSAENLIAAYGVGEVNKFLADRERMVLSEKVPTLTTARNAFGKAACDMIIKTYILDLVSFYGVMSTEDQINRIADSIMFSFHDLKITELMLAFQMMKAGEFRDERDRNMGMMYGSFRGDVILECLRSFRKYRANVIDKAKSSVKQIEAPNNIPSDEERKKIILDAAKDNPILLNIAKANGWI